MLALAFVIIYSRLSFHSPYLYSWDSIGFALSIEHFDMRLHQPHPPGYILYSFTVRAVNQMVGDPNLTMIYLNIAATLGACWFIARLILLLTGKKWLAFLGASLYAFNPVAIFYGSVAEIYAVEGFWVSLIAYLIFASDLKPKYLLFASACMGLAGGFRPTTEMFLLPFFLTGFIRKPLKTALIAIVILLIVNLLWFVPLALMSGGLTQYLHAVGDQSQRAADTEEPGSDSITAFKILVRLIQTASLPVLLMLLSRIHKTTISLREGRLFLAILPPLLLFSLFHLPKDGYLLIVIPVFVALILLFLQGVSPKPAAAAIILGCALNFAGFVYPLKPGNSLSEITRPNRSILEYRTRRLEQFFTIVDGLGGGIEKVFVLENRHFFPNWRTLLYYYPDHSTYVIGSRKKRAFVAKDRKFETILLPVRIPNNAILIAIGRTTPEITMESFNINELRFYFTQTALLPQKFELYSGRCIVSRQ